MIADLTPLFAPRRVAVLGASRNPGKLGHRLVQNLRTPGFAGEVFPAPKSLHPAAVRRGALPAPEPWAELRRTLQVRVGPRSRTLRAALLVLATLVAGCAASDALTPAQETRLRAAANVCQQSHGSVRYYEIDRFGQLVAYYWDVHSPVDATDPFFECVRARLRSGT